MGRFLLGLGLVSAFVVVLTTVGSAHHPSRTSALAPPRVDRMADGSVVVSHVAAGELAGLLTLTLHPAGGGSYVGEWALMVAHADNTDPETGIEPPPHPHGEEHVHPAPGEPAHEVGAHKDFVRFVHRGALFGAVRDASLVFDAQGGLTDVSANLSVDRGTQEFSAALGTGHARLTNLELSF